MDPIFFICLVIDCESVSLSLLQRRGRVRAGGGRRGELQGLLHSSQVREGAGGGGDHHPPQPGKQTRDLVRTRGQQLSAGGAAEGETGGGGTGPVGGKGDGEQLG